MKTYISGQITGLPLCQVHQNFQKAEDLIKAMGGIPVNPMKLHDTKGKQKPWEEYMIKDIEELMKCEAIYMLSNWIHSRGARIEFVIAKEMNKIIKFEEEEKSLVYRTDMGNKYNKVTTILGV